MYISRCIGVFDVAQKKQAEDVDSDNILVCWDSGHHAIYHKVCLILFLESALYDIGSAAAPSTIPIQNSLELLDKE